MKKDHLEIGRLYAVSLKAPLQSLGVASTLFGGEKAKLGSLFSGDLFVALPFKKTKHGFYAHKVICRLGVGWIVPYATNDDHNFYPLV